MTASYQVYIGTDTRRQLSLEEVRQVIFDEALIAFPQGHSIREEMGRYRHADGHAITERTVVVSWTASDEQVRTGEAQTRVGKFAWSCKNRCKQESVMVEKSVVDCVFV